MNKLQLITTGDLASLYQLIRDKLDPKIKISNYSEPPSSDESSAHLNFNILKGRICIGQIEITGDCEIIVAHMDENLLYLYETYDAADDTLEELVEAVVDLIEENYDQFIDIHTGVKKIHELINKIEELMVTYGINNYVDFEYRYEQFDV